MNDQNPTVTVAALGSGASIGTEISSNGGQINDLTLPTIANAPLTGARLTNLNGTLTAAILAASPGAVVNVPGNVITVSPSA